MRVSVVIPTYNAALTIRQTLESVLQQKVAPAEILVLDDGSTDNTPSILESYKSEITIFRRQNGGVASARNALCEHARGDLIAFLDHDDVWHSNYLQAQCSLAEKYPGAAAFFTGHVNFYGYDDYRWEGGPPAAVKSIELMSPLNFLEQYNQVTGPFASVSYCCVPKRVLNELGSEPFCVSGVDDSYLLTSLPLLCRPIVYAPTPFVAYRITKGAQSQNKLRDFGLWVDVFRLLEERYQSTAPMELSRAFKMAFASKRRSYGKILMGVGRAQDARKQFRSSIADVADPESVAKSLALLCLTYMPALLQPKWPPSLRPASEQPGSAGPK